MPTNQTAQARDLPLAAPGPGDSTNGPNGPNGTDRRRRPARARDGRPTETVARTLEATKVYGTGATAVRALDRVTVSFPAGHFTAIMGPSGSGKSTLMHCLAGLDDLTSGRVFLGDVELGRMRDRELTRLRRERIGFVFQAFNLIPTLTAAENITLPLTLGGGSPDPEWMASIVGTVGLADRLKHRPAELSGGQQQRTAVARALVSRPEIVFADEPTGNLDSRSGADILGFMRRAVDDLGQAIVMVTHDPVAASYADEVVFLADGRIVDRMVDPTAAAVLDRLKSLETRATPPSSDPDRDPVPDFVPAPDDTGEM